MHDTCKTGDNNFNIEGMCRILQTFRQFFAVLMFKSSVIERNDHRFEFYEKITWVFGDVQEGGVAVGCREEDENEEDNPNWHGGARTHAWGEQRSRTCGPHDTKVFATILHLRPRTQSPRKARLTQNYRLAQISKKFSEPAWTYTSKASFRAYDKEESLIFKWSANVA